MKKEKKRDKTKKIDLMEFVKMNEKNILALYEINEIKGGDPSDGKCKVIWATIIQ